MALTGAWGLLTAEALLLAEQFAEGHRICVILGDNIIERHIRDQAESFAAQPSGARVLLKEVDDPHRFGVPRFEDDRIVEIIEKPAEPPSGFAVTGLYFYDHDVFNIARQLDRSPRGELEITEVNNAYLRRGDLSHGTVDGWWTDAGTFESLFRANRLVAAGGANRMM